MTKPKPKLKSKAAPAASTPSARAGGKSIVESAQHIWLAGLGAFAKAQDEGTRLFEALVREGVSLEQKTRKLTAGKAEEARGAVEAAVGQVKERSQETWDKLEKVFENRVSRALSRLGVPGSTELKGLTTRIEELAREVSKLNAKPAARAVSKPATSRTSATRSVSRIKDELADVARELESAQLKHVGAKRTAAPAKKPVAKKPVARNAASKKKAGAK
ncbi:MAG: phasin family protein [Dokdonella sp.]|uniref:phasin family protein n=1 Tax=Dokdonella sp. TaxID=2291710 RepID=UPI002C97623E|nr:phasin family protein [Dokdonella sp.]HOX71613.1 phasin family protein [Dokdonella sp.]HPN80768.1 phasin family protein [Dokdonella sp.]